MYVNEVMNIVIWQCW